MVTKARTPRIKDLVVTIPAASGSPTNGKKFSWYYLLLGILTIGFFILLLVTAQTIQKGNDTLELGTAPPDLISSTNKIEQFQFSTHHSQTPSLRSEDHQDRLSSVPHQSFPHANEHLLSRPQHLPQTRQFLSHETLYQPIIPVHELAAPDVSNQVPEMPSIPSALQRSTTSTDTTTTDVSEEMSLERIHQIDPDYEKWKESVYQKLVCLKHHKLMFYFYHVRKAAGTTIRDMMKFVSFRQRISFFETEGIVLNSVLSKLLTEGNIFTMISFRNPVQRIVSLYWYEHVGWYYSILKKPDRIKSMKDWIANWKDGSSHKNNILTKFPYNNYVEVENYYVKLLIGYNHVVDNNRPITREDLEKAKEVLRKFDLVLISEWINDDEEHSLLQTFYKHFYQSHATQQKQMVIQSKIKGDKKMKDLLTPRFAADEEELRRQLTDMNSFDLELYEYAKTLVGLRLKEYKTIVETAALETPDNVRKSMHCQMPARNYQLTHKPYFGVFQPPGHKGP